MRQVFYLLPASLLLLTLPANPQSGNMNNEQQEWFLCLVSKEWCVARSTDGATGQQKAVAMVAAKGPMQLPSGVSRATLQIGCSEGKAVTILHSGRELPDAVIALRYWLEPTGTSGEMMAKNINAGHFFEFPSEAFLQNMQHARKAVVEVKLANPDHSSRLEFDVAGAAKALKKLSCVALAE
jgi:hypothetical protein